MPKRVFGAGGALFGERQQGDNSLKLKSVQVQNFKCIEDSDPFKVGGVTCFVGKNESGKSALLQAMYKLNPVVTAHAPFNALHEYPRRRWTDYKAKVANDPSATGPALSTTWELDDDEQTVLRELVGADAVSDNTVRITKGYGNQLAWLIPLDHTCIVPSLLDHAELFAEERESLDGSDSVAALAEALESKSDKSPREAALLAAIVARFPQKDVSIAARALLEPKLPKFVYFDRYYRMDGQISVNEIKQKQANNSLTDNDRVFLALLALARTDMASLEAMTQFEPLRAELEGVSIKLTDEIFEYWSQNAHLEVEFFAGPASPGDAAPFNEGVVFRTRIKNQRHRVTVAFDERSAGFVWFFSFLVWFSQIKAQHGERLIILLDEPGLTLHGRAQADLLRYINERLKPNYQVMYTTHSPFMVDPDNLLGARTVEDVVLDDGKTILGTKVGDDILSTDADTVFPLQGALGYDISQTLFVGKHNLLVEGPSDVLYLKWASNVLAERGRRSLDLRWTLVPTGGIDKISSFISLFSGKKLDIAALTDFAEGQKGRVRDLRATKLLEAGRVFGAEKYAAQPEADTEDILGRELYIDVVNRCYSLRRELWLPVARPAGSPQRVVKEVEAHFAALPPEVPTFEHYAPAQYLVMNWGTLRDVLRGPTVTAALDRFEQFFTEVNAVLA